MGGVADHELGYGDPLENREEVTIARGVEVPEEIEERLRDEDDDEDGEDE